MKATNSQLTMGMIIPEITNRVAVISVRIIDQKNIPLGRKDQNGPFTLVANIVRWPANTSFRNIMDWITPG